MLPIEDFCCQNSQCVLYGQKGQGNLRQKGWSSKTQQIRKFICLKCGKYFSERKGTALYRSRIDTGKAIDVFNHLQDGCGIRQTARLLKVSKDVVNRLARKAGEHADKVHAELVAFSPSDPGDST